MGMTIKQIADEIGVTKQAVYKRFKGKLSKLCAPYAYTKDGILYLNEQGVQIIKDDFTKVDKELEHSKEGLEHPIGAAEHSNGAAETVLEHSKEGLEHPIGAAEHSNGAADETQLIEAIRGEYTSEIEFLRHQVEHLQSELEKEREHNREKDKLLMDTLSRLAETQAAVAVGQSAEKQTALAVTLLEGQHKFDEPKSDTDNVYDVNSANKSKKSGWFKRLWAAVMKNK